MRLEDDVETPVKKRRLADVQGLQKLITRDRMLAWEGRTAQVLVEGPSKRDSSWMSGRISQNWIVNFEAPERLVGSTVEVAIEAAFSNSFQGRAAGVDVGRASSLNVLN
jgi:tRNA-2-methylthio-N6-dimethylallyladenosine synthase